MALIEVADAVVAVWKNCMELDILDTGIFLFAFSAGGHLVAFLAIHWNKPMLQTEYAGHISKPDAVILSYPIITEKTHRVLAFMEELYIEETDAYFSWLNVEVYVNSGTPLPCFLWHNGDDEDVSVINSLLFMSALVANKVPFEVYIWPADGHGLSSADDTVASLESEMSYPCGKWTEDAIRWMKEIRVRKKIT